MAMRVFNMNFFTNSTSGHRGALFRLSIPWRKKCWQIERKKTLNICQKFVFSGIPMWISYAATTLYVCFLLTSYVCSQKCFLHIPCSCVPFGCRCVFVCMLSFVLSCVCCPLCSHIFLFLSVDSSMLSYLCFPLTAFTGVSPQKSSHVCPVQGLCICALLCVLSFVLWYICSQIGVHSCVCFDIISCFLKSSFMYGCGFITWLSFVSSPLCSHICVLLHVNSLLCS